MLEEKKAGRHQAQAVVEGINSLLSKIIQTRMISEEIINKENSSEWVEEIPSIITVVNKYFYHKPSETDIENHIPIKVKKESLASNVLTEGTPVRIQLDNPVDAVETKRLNGSFRIGDIQWENVIRNITQVYLRPDFPPMYQVDKDDDDNNVAYTRNQLQVVLSNKKKLSTKLRKKEIVEKLLKRVVKGKKVFFEIQWNSGKITTEPRTSLIKDIPGLIEEFEEIEENQPEIISQFKIRNKIYYKVKYGNGDEIDEPKTQFIKRFPTIIEEYDNLLLKEN